jgi:dTDP-4-dehydrorhamnose 3,5-epimerase
VTRVDGDGRPVGAATKDEAHITPEWELTVQRIDGLRIREMRNVVTGNGITTELFRKDWRIVGAEVTAMIHVTLHVGAVSAWHMHKLKTDHLFVVGGALRAVLYDDREESPTRDQLDVINLSPMRPMLVVIPPGIWHGFKVLGSMPASFVNFFDHEYDYADPDDWRLPADAPEIPYRF